MKKGFSSGAHVTRGPHDLDQSENCKIRYLARKKLEIILGTSFSFQKCLLDPSGGGKKIFYQNVPVWVVL